MLKGGIIQLFYKNAVGNKPDYHLHQNNYYNFLLSKNIPLSFIIPKIHNSSGLEIEDGVQGFAKPFLIKISEAFYYGFCYCKTVLGL